jgi:hypothetical protein
LNTLLHNYLSLLSIRVRGWHCHEALGNEFVLNHTSSPRLQLSHHLLLASTALATLLKFTHIFPVALALLLLGIDTAGIKGSGAG